MTTASIKDLELDILAGSLHVKGDVRRATEALDGYRFSNKPGQWVWRAITEAYREYAAVPAIKVLAVKAQNDIRRDDLFEEVVELLRELAAYRDPEDLVTVLPEVVKAHNQQAILSTVDELIEAAEDGDMDAAHEALGKGQRAVTRRSDRTGNAGLVELARQALVETDGGDFVPTGLAWVDRRIRGIAKGEVFQMAGITGIGKSVAMIQSGQSALGAGKRVIHFTTEMTREQVAWRYLSRFTGIPEQNIRERRMSVGEIKLLDSWLTRNETRMNDLLRIEQVLPNIGTIADIQAALMEMERDGRPADLVLIDSPDHLRSLRKYNNWIHESTEVWWGVKAIADRGHAVWTTTQVARGKWEHQLATPEAVSDNYNKARIASAFFSVNWVVDKAGKPTGKRRLFWGKYRSGSSRHIIPLRCDLSRMIMVTEPEPEDLEGVSVD